MSVLLQQNKRKAVFLDRDGVLNRAIVRGGRPYAPRRIEDFTILSEAPAAVRRLKAAGYMTIVATNQRDVGAGLLPRHILNSMHLKLLAAMPLDDIRVCTCINECPCYKPNMGMLVEAAQDWNIDLSASVMIGDRWRDIGAGKNAGCLTIFIDRGYAEMLPHVPDLVATDLADAVDKLLSSSSPSSGSAK